MKKIINDELLYLDNISEKNIVNNTDVVDKIISDTNISIDLSDNNAKNITDLKTLVTNLETTINQFGYTIDDYVPQGSFIVGEYRWFHFDINNTKNKQTYLHLISYGWKPISDKFENIGISNISGTVVDNIRSGVVANHTHDIPEPITKKDTSSLPSNEFTTTIEYLTSDIGNSDLYDIWFEMQPTFSDISLTTTCPKGEVHEDPDNIYDTQVYTYQDIPAGQYAQLWEYVGRRT